MDSAFAIRAFAIRACHAAVMPPTPAFFHSQGHTPLVEGQVQQFG